MNANRCTCGVRWFQNSPPVVLGWCVRELCCRVRIDYGLQLGSHWQGHCTPPSLDRARLEAMAAGMGIGGSFSMGDIGMSQGGGGPSPAKVVSVCTAQRQSRIGTQAIQQIGSNARPCVVNWYFHCFAAVVGDETAWCAVLRRGNLVTSHGASISNCAHRRGGRPSHRRRNGTEGGG